jgi:membrane protein involved in colicin uptake
VNSHSAQEAADARRAAEAKKAAEEQAAAEAKKKADAEAAAEAQKKVNVKLAAASGGRGFVGKSDGDCGPSGASADEPNGSECE